MEQHRNAQQLRALDVKQLDDAAALQRACEDYSRTAGVGRQGDAGRLRSTARALVDASLLPPASVGEASPSTAPQEAAPLVAEAGPSTTLTVPDGPAVSPSTPVPPAAAPTPSSAADASLLPPAILPPTTLLPPVPAAPSLDANAQASSSSAPPRKRPRRDAALVRIHALTRQMQTTASEKQSLASDAYDKTDRHIRTLDTSLAAHMLAGRHVPDDLAGPSPTANGAAAADDDDEGSVLLVQPRVAPGRGRPRKGKERAARATETSDAGDYSDIEKLSGAERVRAELTRAKVAECVLSPPFLLPLLPLFPFPPLAVTRKDTPLTLGAAAPVSPPSDPGPRPAQRRADVLLLRAAVVGRHARV